jgi:hypothetical protein
MHNHSVPILGLSGKKRCGKDVFTDAIVEDSKTPGSRPVFRIAFADALKDEACQLLGITREQLEQDKAHFRPFLQWYGTEHRRNYGKHPNYWVDKVNEKVQPMIEAGHAIIITDVRFYNEVQYVLALGGMVIRVVREEVPESCYGQCLGIADVKSVETGKAIAPRDTHSSETELDSYHPMITIYNRPDNTPGSLAKYKELAVKFWREFTHYEKMDVDHRCDFLRRYSS